MKYLKTISLSFVFLSSFTTTALACVSQEELDDAKNSKYTSTDYKEDYCPTIDKLLKEGMCKKSRKEQISIRKMNSYLSDYYENCK